MKRSPIKRKTKSRHKILKAKLQEVFNKYIRLRDALKGCCTCGGQVQHAGHFIAVGGHEMTRYMENNVHGQCCHCNTFLGGNLIEYYEFMKRTYGQEVIDDLRSLSNKPVHLPDSWYEEMIERYKDKIN